MKNPKRTKAKQNRLLKVLVIIVIIITILIGAVAVLVYGLYKSGEAGFRRNSTSNVPVIDFNPETKEEHKKKLQSIVEWQDDWVVYNEDVYEYNEGSINLLLLGIDQAGKLDSSTDLSDWSAGQADAVFLVSLNNTERSVSIIGIPRNSMVKLDIYDKDGNIKENMYNQLCLQYGYAGGGELGIRKMKEKVSEIMYQLPIHGVCAINFNAIGILVDKIGGVEVTVPEDLTVVNKSFKQGANVTITGKNAKNYLRYRDITKLGTPTLRLTRQKEFLQSAIAQGIEALKKNPMLISEIYQALVPYMNTDITVDMAVYLAAEAAGYRIDGNSFYQLEGEDKKVDFVTESGREGFYDDLYLNDDSVLETVMSVFYHQVVIDSKEP